MKLTAAHLEYWRQKKTPTPRWAESLSGPMGRRVRIHQLIPTPGGRPRSVTHNTVTLVAAARDRYPGSALLDYLADMADRPGVPGRSDALRRASFARKWRWRIINERKKKARPGNR